MAIYCYKWKRVRGGYLRESQMCPRCNNVVRFELVWDSDGVGIGSFFLIYFKKIYAYKCPICPNFELVSNELVKAIKRG